MKAFRQIAFLLGVSIGCGLFSSAAFARTWSKDEANRWYLSSPWLVGSNFIPKDASNALEMWQPETFNLVEIDRELGLAEGLGMTTMRVFLHDLPWKEDRRGFIRRIDAFLEVASRHGIRPMFVLFDSCWDPLPVSGKQRPPRPGVHNSRWVQSPGIIALGDRSEKKRLEDYVSGIVSAFARDPRILAWDVWNEPDNVNSGSYNDPAWKVNAVEEWLPQVFAWARSSNPSQPLTSAVWYGEWGSDEKLRLIERIQLEESDIITFHNYGKPEDFNRRVAWLRRYDRPILCTEYMARPLGSTFRSILPLARERNVALYNWGFVAGRTQTYIPWDSWKFPYPRSGPLVWFHDIFHSDGSPYRAAETDLIRRTIDGAGR